MEEVLDMIPAGLSAQDSVALFRAIVEGWTKDVVISDFAKDKIQDLSEIDRKVNDYRNNLIVQEYLSRMSDSQEPKIEEKEIRRYYELHRGEMKLEEPLVKGILLKINSETKGKDQLKTLLTTDSPESTDKLEQEWLDKALEYYYFHDKWVNWETVSTKIPYRFDDSDEFLKENQFFETEYDDCSYYLVITDYLPTGEEQPYEYASGWIKGVLTRQELAQYEGNLIESILKKSIKDKKLKPVGYDPVKHVMKERKNK